MSAKLMLKLPGCCAGQGNYGYANSVCDMLCMSRRAAGKPALAIAWGPVDHVGYVAEILKVPVTLLLDSAAPDPAQACMLRLQSEITIFALTRNLWFFCPLLT